MEEMDFEDDVRNILFSGMLLSLSVIFFFLFLMSDDFVFFLFLLFFFFLIFLVTSFQNKLLSSQVRSNH